LRNVHIDFFAHIDHRLVDVAAAYSLTEAGDVVGNPADSVCTLSLSVKPLSILTNTTRTEVGTFFSSADADQLAEYKYFGIHLLGSGGFNHSYLPLRV
jgi:hypothetical protein